MADLLAGVLEHLLLPDRSGYEILHVRDLAARVP